MSLETKLEVIKSSDLFSESIIKHLDNAVLEGNRDSEAISKYLEENLKPETKGLSPEQIVIIIDLIGRLLH